MDTGVRAIVQHEYQAKEPDELNLVKFDQICNIKMQPGGWWEGTLISTGQTGMFPDNFVVVVDSDDKNPVVLRDKAATQNRRCKAVYSYTQNNNDELTLAVGDIIEFLGEVEEGWWKGKLGTKVGVFPSNFVVTLEHVSPILARRSTGVGKTSTEQHSMKFKTEISSSREDIVAATANATLEKDAPILPPKPVRELCKVLFPYPPSNEDELELKEGDIISIINKELPDKGWWKGELRGKIGVFPDNFVIPLSPEASPSKDATSSNQKPDRPLASSKIIISSKSSNRKDSFGSRDSLSDPVHTNIPTGNVAAYRKSLENKVMDMTAVEKTNRKSIEMKNDLRKSMENLEEKKTTPPPVLTKKPIVPIKKSPTVGATGGIFSGIKSKTKTDGKMSSNDSLDGISSSKSVGNVADNNDKGIVGERLKRETTEFDQVERGSILQDMRAGRAKAPKRRPPTTSSNSFGESANDTSYQNGGNGHLETEQKSESVDEEIAKPKSRNWEKQKAPWMDELKANQAKKTSPNFENRSPDNNNKSTDHETNEKFDMSKSFSSSFVSSHKKLSDSNNFDMRSNSVDVKPTHSVDLNNRKDVEHTTAKSMPTKPSEPITITTEDPAKIRPTSVNLRNRSVSPVARFTKSVHVPPSNETTKLINNDIGNDKPIINNENVCSRVADLEQKVVKLEKLVLHQSQKIEELLRSIKVESEKVKILKAAAKHRRGSINL
ncbi:CD2-associated protein [Pseudolycoriella hygida]|uniref:CD2-associated protein n=1 Tax=Pseudolycoriella hygida TaxID=35572 RepID=A0A9Q0MVG8_9DIPT|nr:CD2-associated protein [Pseudolycoriella hygida]